MDPKISSNIWPDLAEHPAEVKLTFLWCITNAETTGSKLGVFTWRAKQFEFDTGLDAGYFHETLKVMPRALLMVEERVWLRHYIAYQYGSGESLVKNSLILKGLVRCLESLPRRLKGLQETILDVYPELKGHTSSLQAPLRVFPAVEHEGLATNGLSPQGPEIRLLPEGATKPLQVTSEGTRAEQSRADQIKGESEGGALVPQEAEVLRFGREWTGDAARGIPSIMPEGYVLSWLAWRMGESAPPFPKDWRSDLERRFKADWVKRRADTRHAPGVTSGKTAPEVDKAGLVEALALEKDPERRRQILARMKKAAE